MPRTRDVGKESSVETGKGRANFNQCMESIQLDVKMGFESDF